MNYITGTVDGLAALIENHDRLKQENAELREALNSALPLLRLLTVRQVLNGGDEAIAAAGLNPWCINEGLADGSERISTWKWDVNRVAE